MYFQNKVEGYKAQDRKKARETDSEEYVDVEWMMERMNSNCQRCNKNSTLPLRTVVCVVTSHVRGWIIA